MDVVQATRHMGTAFLNGVETCQEEAAYLVLQMPITQMRCEVVFILTSPPGERMHFVKDTAELEQMDKNSADIMKKWLVGYYRCQPK